MTGQKKHKGFTLVEVMVALTIFAIAVSTLFASFNIIISNIDPINVGLDNYELAQNTMERIQKDLNSLCLTHDPIYTPPNMEEKEESDRFRFVSERVYLDNNSFSQLRFASFEHLAFQRNLKTDIGIIKYYVEPSQDGTFVLKRSDIETVLFDESRDNNTKNDLVLCERIKIFELTFIGQDGDIHENWNSDSLNFGFSTPYSVMIKLELGGRIKSDVFVTTILLPTFRDKNES